MISKRAKYAMKALIRLTEEYGKGPLMISELARQAQIPQRFLEAILLDMRNHGLLHSQKGKGGGYMLRVEPERVNLAQVLRIIDGPIAPTPCVSKNFYVRCDDCLDEETCRIRSVMVQVRDANLAVYETISLKALAAQTPNTLALTDDEVVRA